MVIEEVIKQSGVIDHPKYEYNWETKNSMFVCMEPFYYKKVYIIDGEEFVLGSLEEGKTDTLLETTTGVVALRKTEVGSFTDDNIIRVMSEKLGRHLCDTLHEVIIYFQNNLSAHRIELWQINLVIS